MTEIIIANIALLIFNIALSIAGITLALLAAQQFAKELGTGMMLLAVGMIIMAVNFLLGMVDHLQLGGITLPFAHTGWVHGATISAALVILLAGFYKVHRAALGVEKRITGKSKK